MRFADKVAIVTGSAHGIGRGYALALAREGAWVAVADIHFEAAEGVAAEIRREGGQALAVAVDVSDEAQTLAMARTTAEAFGGVDILINNAAIFAHMERHSLLQVPLAYWNKFMSVNLTGALLCARAVVPHMVRRGKGKILNQSSTAAYTAR